MKREAGKEAKGFVWYSLRVSFALLILIVVLQLIFPVLNMIVLNLFSLLLLLFAFVISIVHLAKYKRKAFAVVTLVLSALLILFYIIGIVSLASAA